MSNLVDIKIYRQQRQLDICLASVLDAYCDLLEGNTEVAIEQLGDLLSTFALLKAEVHWQTGDIVEFNPSDDSAS